MLLGAANVHILHNVLLLEFVGLFHSLCLQEAGHTKKTERLGNQEMDDQIKLEFKPRVLQQQHIVTSKRLGTIRLPFAMFLRVELCAFSFLGK